MSIKQLIRELGFDPNTAIVTAVAVGFLFFLFRLVQKRLVDGFRWLVLGITYHLSLFLTKTASASLTLRRYCRLQLAGDSKTLLVPGIFETSVDIDAIFVPLTMERAGRSKRFSHETVLEAGNRIRIIGDPGSGKSSIAKRIFRDACNEGARNPRQARFPILLELRKIQFPRPKSNNPNFRTWLWEYIRQEVKKVEVYDVDRCLDSYVRLNGMLIILDGLDEIASAAYPVAESTIQSLSEFLSQLGANNVVVVTMRTQFHQQVKTAFSQTFPALLSLQPFTPTHIYTFLQRWDFDPSVKSRQILRIYNDLTDRPSLREMCTNPLVLAMYVAHDQASQHPQTPETRTEFYRRVTEELLVRRRVVQIGVSVGQALIREQRQRILGRIAFDHLCDPEQPANLLDWKKAIGVVQEIRGGTLADAEAELREISKDTGLITEERASETFRFIHLTFCEFLAAMEGVQERPDGWSELLHRHHEFRNDNAIGRRTRLSEVLPFACALMPRHMRVQAISDLSQLGDDRALVLSFLETKTYDHPLWLPFIESNQRRLASQTPTEPDSDWFREVHLFMVVCGDADRSSSALPNVKASQLNDFFERLSKRDNGSILRLIESYAAQDAASAFHIASLCKIDLLAQLPEVVVRNCDQPPFLAVALESASNEAARFVAWSCAIGEAAVSSLVVARALVQMDIPLWKTSTAELPQYRWWFGRGIIPRSAFTECLSVACSDYVTDLSKFPVIENLRKIRAPGGRHLQTQFPAGFSLLLAVGLFAIVLAIRVEIDGVAEIIDFSSVVILSLLCFFVSNSYLQMRKRLYARLLHPGLHHTFFEIATAESTPRISPVIYFLFNRAERICVRNVLSLHAAAGKAQKSESSAGLF